MSHQRAAGRECHRLALTPHMRRDLDSPRDSRLHTPLVSADLDSVAGAYHSKPIHVDANPRNGTIQLVGHGFKQDGPPPQPHTGDPIKLPPRTTPPPPTVITASPPEEANTPDHGGVGFPKCEPEDVLGDGIEIVAGGLLTAASVPVEGATLGLGGLAGLVGGGGLVYDGVKGLEECK